MNAREFLKINDSKVLDIIKKIENRIIIEKDNDVSGRLFFDYDDNHRIEIKSKNIIYHTTSLKTDKIYIENITIYGTNTIVTENNLILGSLISDDKNIGIITDIKEADTTGKKSVNIVKIYSTVPLMWKDYR